MLLDPTDIARFIFEAGAAIYQANHPTSNIGAPTDVIDDKFKSVPKMFVAFERTARVIAGLSGTPVAGFPSFDAMTASTHLSGTFIRGDFFSRDTIDSVNADDIRDTMRRADGKSRERGFHGAYPSWINNEIVQLKQVAVDVVDVPVSQLELPVIFHDCGQGYFWDPNWQPPPILSLCIDPQEKVYNIPSEFLSVYMHSVRAGKAGGYPNFNQADYGNGVVFGVIRFQPEMCATVRLHWRIIDALGSDFDFRSYYEFVPSWSSSAGFSLTGDQRAAMYAKFGSQVEIPGA